MAAPAPAAAAAAASAPAPSPAAAAASAPLPITLAPSNRHSLQLWTAPPARSPKQPVMLASVAIELRAMCNHYADDYSGRVVDTRAGVLKAWLDAHDQQADAVLSPAIPECRVHLTHGSMMTHQCDPLLADPQARGLLLPTRDWATLGTEIAICISGPVTLRLVESASGGVLREWRFAYKDARVDSSASWWSLTSDDQAVVLLAHGHAGRDKTKIPGKVNVDALVLLEAAWRTPELTAIRAQLADDGVARALAVADRARQMHKERVRKAQEELDAADASYERCAKRLKPTN